MRTLFKEKNSKFGAMISLVALVVMLMLFSIFIPVFISSTSGRIFVAVWAIMAIVAFTAHARSITVAGKQRYIPKLSTKKAGRISKQIRPERLMRGM